MMFGWTVFPVNTMGALPFAVKEGGPVRSKTEFVTVMPAELVVVTSIPGTAIDPRPMMSAFWIDRCPDQLAALRIREPLLLVISARLPVVPLMSRFVLPERTRSLVRFIVGPLVVGTSMTVTGMCWL